MRTPTVLRDLYSWHRAALAGLRPQITHEPQCGFFERRLVKGGPTVPARIWLDQNLDAEAGELLGDERLRCEVGGKERDPGEEWLWLANYPVSEADYLYLVASADWCRKHEPQSPEANPTRATRLRAIPRLF